MRGTPGETQSNRIRLHAPLAPVRGVVTRSGSIARLYLAPIHGAPGRGESPRAREPIE